MQEHSQAPSPRALTILREALQRVDSTEREHFLDEACKNDAILKDWVAEEIRRRAEDHTHVVGAPLSPAPPSSSASTLSPEVEAMLAALRPEEPGDRLGSYKLISMLGEGGFGTVWLAEQESPIRREVALKVLKVGMNTRQVIGRFEQERQTLASLDHPGIARVFDAGVTAYGRPFFAMELVRGSSITDFCDDRRLTVRERLELFMRVCFAVQHAHQKAIIHRDLKPSNLLVTLLNDGSYVPKVIDLGLAKVTETSTPGEHTLVVTMEQALIGTPLYMSPEQAEGSQGLDTRTDIYSLGVILYELLTGRTPHRPGQLSRASDDEIRRAIRELEPSWPSAAVREMEDGPLSVTTQHRDTTRAALIRNLRGELDAICLRALEKDPRRRYTSAAALASDIQHYLLDEPISARTPSQWYRMRKFTRRHRTAVLTVAFVAFTILAASAVSVREALRAREAERLARTAQADEAQQRERAEEHEEQAQNERAIARLNEYVADVGLAQQSLQTGNYGRALSLLEKHRPEGTEHDYRGWAWRYLWQIAQGDAHTTLPPLQGPAGAVAFSPSGLLAIGGQSSISIYNARARQVVANLASGADHLAFLPGGKLMVSFARDELTLWKTEDWTVYAAWTESPGAFALSPDGRLVAVAAPDGVRLRSTSDWHEERLIRDARGPVAFSPDGASLVAVHGAGLAIWKVDAEAEPLALAGSEGLPAHHPDSLFQLNTVLALAAGGEKVIAVENHTTPRGVFILRTWDARTGAELTSLPADPERPEHHGAIASLAVSPDGQTLATTSLDHSVRLWDLRTGRRTAVLQGHHAEVGGAAFSPDGQNLVTCDRLGQVKAWSVQRPPDEDTITDARALLGFSGDGRRVAILSAQNEFILTDAAQHDPPRKIALPAPYAPSEKPPLVSLSADGQTLAQAQPGGRVQWWDVPTGATHSLPLAEQELQLLALTPSGDKLIFQDATGPVRVRALRTEGPEEKLPFRASRVVVSPDGRLLAAFAPTDETAAAHIPGAPLVYSGPADNQPLSPAPIRILLWSLREHRLRAELPSGGVPLDAAFSPNGTVFATAGTDNAIHLWGTGTGVALGVCTGHKQIVRALAFSHDGETLASASDDGTLRLWTIVGTQELLSIQRLGIGMHHLLFSPDDRLLAVSERRGEGLHDVRLYRAPLLGEIPGAASSPR